MWRQQQFTSAKLARWGVIDMWGKMLQVLGLGGTIILKWIWATYIMSTGRGVVNTTLKFRGYMKDGNVLTDCSTGSLLNRACSLLFIRTPELWDSTYVYGTLPDRTYIYIHYQTVPTCIARYQTVPTYIAHYQTVPTYIAHYQNSWRPPSILPSSVLFTHNAVFCKFSSAPSSRWYAAGCCVGLTLHLISRPTDTQWTLLPRVGVCMWGSFDKTKNGCWHNRISYFGSSHHYHYNYRHHHHHHHPMTKLGL